MPRTWFIAVLAALALLAAPFGAACGDGLSATNVPIPTERPLPTNDPPPDEVLRASRDNFAKIESFRTRFKIDYESLNGTVEGEAGHRSGAVLYSRTVYTGDTLRQAGFEETLFLPPNLYFKVPAEGWFVMSPWSQGLRLDELEESNIDKPLLDYDVIMANLSVVERLPNETISGEDYMRYSGVIPFDSLPWLVPEYAAFTRETTGADVWINSQSYLPHKVQIDADLPGGASFVVTIEFFDLGQAITLPEPVTDARPIRNLQFPDAPCMGDDFATCLDAATEIQPTGSESCDGEGKRICLVPLGQVSPDLVAHLVAHYREEYGLTVNVLTPIPVPEAIANRLRGQIDASVLIDYMGNTFRDAYQDSQAILIGLTPLDLYHSTSHFRYVFGVKGTPEDPKAVISTWRMNPETYSEPSDDELLLSRTRKMLTKYLGLLYYELPTSSDPRSPMYDSILSPGDLDRMNEPLPAVDLPSSSAVIE